MIHDQETEKPRNEGSRPAHDFPIFITGTQRSGTTLLHQILDSSSVVWSKNEMWDIHELVHGADDLPIEQFQHQLRRHLIEEFEASIFTNDKRGKLANFEAAMTACAFSKGKKRWCLKDPRITYYLSQYAQTFPEAKFFILVRDPRAVCHSYLHSPGFRVGRPTNAYAGAVRWRNEVRLQLRFAQKHSRQCLVVKYEMLVREFASMLENICSFAEVPLIENMTNYHESPGGTRVHAGNRNILRPPDPSRIDRWREAMSERQIRIIDAVAAELMEELEYEPDSEIKPISPLLRHWLALHEEVVSRWRWKRFQLNQKLRSR